MLRLLTTKTKTTTSLRSSFTPSTPLSHLFGHHLSTSNKDNKDNDDKWNDAWETAWLPENTKPTSTQQQQSSSPWETDVNFGLLNTDPETKAFVEDMTENWDTRRRGGGGKMKEEKEEKEEERKKERESGVGVGLYGLESVKRDYRVRKQKVHAGLWMKEIEKLEEEKLNGGDGSVGVDDIDKLLDSCSEIFESRNEDLNDAKVPGTSEFKNKPDGWETTSKSEDGNVWEMTQREEDILLQEFDRRMAFCKFQIASFIKTHIFSRRRPIDGWKYMIEVIGPNAKKGKGSAPRIPGLADPATQPFTEDRPPVSGGRLTSSRQRGR